MPKKIPHCKVGGYLKVWKNGIVPKASNTEAREPKPGRVWIRWALLCTIRHCPCRHYATKKAARQHFPGSDPKRIKITLL